MKAKAILLVGLLFVASCSNVQLAENQQFPKEYKTWSWYPLSDLQNRYTRHSDLPEKFKAELAQTMSDKGYTFQATPGIAEFLVELRYKESDMYNNELILAQPLPEQYPPIKSRPRDSGYYLMRIYDKQSGRLIWSNRVKSVKSSKYKDIANSLNSLPNQKTYPVI